jgi:hypothetical protein
MSEQQSETLRAQQAVEAVLAHRAANEPGFLERVVMDPHATVEPIIAEVLEDDGDLDLSGVAINVHVQTPKSLHFVMATDDVGEVSGFAQKFVRADLSSRLSFQVLAPSFGGTILGASDTGTQCGYTSESGESDAKCKPSTL